ncbi:M20/M25/M40 family metallo-hydrolase [Bacillus gobiensis]|uniref:M20/M25/M40 family metallo-hydrolase n=1 Tax=Bacillus gobiensis TaxID=1441095 RepID=UPI003D1C61CE
MVFISNDIRAVFEDLSNDLKVKKGLEFLKADNDQTTTDQIELTEISAPTFYEDARGQRYAEKLKELGLQQIETDEAGNVFGLRPGTGNGPKLVICAHLDTVFPAETDVKAAVKDGKVYAPGISDDGRGLAAVLTLTRALQNVEIETEGDLLIGATVGEEGLGDLYGVKALFQNRNDIDGFISIEPGTPDRVVYQGVGSRRYEVTFTGPGGHSFGSFGTASAIHALGRAIHHISSIQPPKEPKTTFNVGVINGGTSVNTIAQNASMLVDIRSVAQEELAKLEQVILGYIQQAADEENAHWTQDAISVQCKLVGDRPAGTQPEDSVIVQAALASAESLGYQPELDQPSSTDSNVPINLGIPAVTLGGGGDSGGAHTLEEYFDPMDAYVGPQRILLAVLALVGVKGVCEPLLKKKNLKV